MPDTVKRRAKPASSSLDLSNVFGTTTKKPIVSIYMGWDRIRDAQARADASGVSLSALVCNSLDAAIALSPELARRLEGLAVAKGTTTAALLAKIVREALKSV